MTREPKHPGIVLKEIWIDRDKITIKEGADIVGVKRRLLSSVLNGRALVSNDLAATLLNILGIDMTPFLEQWKLSQDANRVAKKGVRYRSQRKQRHYDSWKALIIEKDE